mgnify:CR=1 FL=1
MNDKSFIAIVDLSSEDALYEDTLYYDRVDYLQYNNNGDMNELCTRKVYSLEVIRDTLYIFTEE